MATHQNAVLTGYDPESPQPHLRFGDVISLIPSSVNGITTFAGAADARPWVEKIRQGVSTPPNLRDCQFKLLPRRQYAEDKALKKLIRRRSWDGGKNLPLPPVPREDANIKMLAEEYSRKHGIDLRPSLIEVFQRLIAAAEEMQGNASEEARQMKSTIHYGDAVQLQHIATKTMPTISKQQAIERGSKKVEMVEGGEEDSIFEVAPAFKTFGTGEPVSSGDLIVLKTKKRIGGLHYYLRMSTLPKFKGTEWRSVMRQLQLENDAVIGVEEINAATEHVPPTAFRPLLFSPLENSTQHKNVFQAEHVVCFYHKEAEAYLDYNPVQSTLPMFRASKRVAYKARKKSSWMWKIESTCTVNAAAMVNCSDAHHYRIKHVVTNLYLKQDHDRLEMTADYTDDSTLFSFRTFSKHGNNRAMLQSLVYIRSRTGFWLTQDQTNTADQREETEPGKEKGLLMSHQEFASERDALLLLPPLPSSVTAVVQMGRVVRRLRNFSSLLENVPPVEGLDADLPSMMLPGKDTKLSRSAEQVLRLTDEVYDGVIVQLRTLLLSITFDDDPNPMSRDGVPNRLLQKLLREMHAISIIMKVVQLPFERGISLSWMEVEGNKPSLFDEDRVPTRLTNLLRIISMCYRLLKQLVKQDRRNAEELHNHVSVIRSHLGRGLSCEATLKEMFDGQRSLLSTVEEDLIAQIVDLLSTRKDPRYLDILLSLCQCNGEPMPQNQALIGRLLVENNGHLLPKCRLSRATSSTGANRVLLQIHVHGTHDPVNAQELWIDLRKYAEAGDDSQQRGAYVGDAADRLLNEEYSSLEEEEKLVRYFIRCTNLFSKLVLGRNQKNLALLLNNEQLCFSYQEILDVLQEPSLPALIRARYSTMMMNLYVDRAAQHGQRVSFSNDGKTWGCRSTAECRNVIWFQMQPSMFQSLTVASGLADPQASKPQILYTRPWSKVKPEGSDLAGRAVSSKGAIAPVCMTGFTDLVAHLLEELSRTGAELRRGLTFGKLELARAQVELTDILVDFGFFLKNANTVHVDFRDVLRLSEAVFSMLETTNTVPTPSKTREGVMHATVRSVSLRLLLRIWNLRADFRISCAIQSWEQLFEKLQTQDPSMKKLRVAGTSRPEGPSTIRAYSMRDARKQELVDAFKEQDDEFTSLEQTLFRRDIVTPASIGADRYEHLGHETGDMTVDTLLALLGYRDMKLSQDVCSLLFRHISQRTRIASDLQEVQLLVFPAAVKVYGETHQAIKELISIKKVVSKGDAAAVSSANELLKRMTSYLEASATNHQQIVQKNQRIMLNLELDEPVCDLLRLSFDRDTSRRDNGERETDAPLDPARRDLFQCCYDFLRALTEGHERAQKKLFPLITFFCDHMGVEQLNVADTIGTIVKDNPAICQQVSESFLRQFTSAIKTWGRKNRWLATLKVFLEVNGRPFKRNQDMILRCLLDDSDVLLDLTCDYTESAFLPKSDERYGTTRVQLLKDGDHLRKVRSLIKYHCTSIDILAMCAAGKNAVNQEKIFHLVDFASIVNNIMDLEQHPDGRVDEVADLDALHFVRVAWVRLMRHVYIASFDSGAVKKVQGCSRLWGQSYSPQTGRRPSTEFIEGPRRGSMSSNVSSEEILREQQWTGAGLLEEFVSSLVLLRKRLDSMKQGQGGWCQVLLDAAADSFGNNIGYHVKYVDEVLETLALIFCRTDYTEHVKDVEMTANPDAAEEAVDSRTSRQWTAFLAKELPRLALALNEKELPDSVEKVSNLIAEMSRWGVDVKFDTRAMVAPGSAEEEECEEIRFSQGWGRFVERLALGLGVSLVPGRAMDRGVKELAVLFGQRRKFNEEYQGLRELMRLMCSKDCDGFVRLNGLKLVRAILYIGDHTGSDRDTEYQRMLDNQPPSDAVNDSAKLKRLQADLARLGATDVIVSCLPADDPDIVFATLCLAVALLEGGNAKVQAMFEATLSPASSQDFFLALQKLFSEAVSSIKEEKKQAKAIEAALAHRSSATIRQAKTRTMSESAHGQAYMAEVMKMMRRMFMGQNKKMQNIFRQQRLNRISIDCFDLAVNYLIALEPELKRAIAEDNTDLVESAIRGFLMLSDSMRGPNYANQTAIANTGIFDLGDRIFFKIRFEDCTANAGGGSAYLSSRAARRIMRKTVPAEELADEKRRNLLRGRLKQAVLTCLHQFLEGVQEEAIPNHMLLTCQWSSITQQIVSCVALLETERSDIVDIPSVRHEALSYYFLFKLLRTFDKTDSVIPQAMSAAPQAMAYLEARTGYVEISRNDHLERIYFALPHDCFNGGPLDRTFEEMYDAERGDPDRKNQGWLSNMRKLVEREEFNDRIRSSYLAFTVYLSGSISAISLAWVFVIHLVMVLGGYVPAAFKAEQKEFISAGGAGGDFEDDFERKVLPPVAFTARVMTWIFLIICLLRFFIFCCLHLPTILEKGKIDENSEDNSANNTTSTSPLDDDVDVDVDSEEAVLRLEGDIGDLPAAKNYTIQTKDPSSVVNAADADDSTEVVLRHPLRVIMAQAWTVLKSGWAWYETLFLCFAVLAVGLNEPVYTSFSLLEVCFWKGSKTVIDAIWFNLSKMLQTMMLGLLVLYLWMIIGMGVLQDQLADGMCHNMFQCFVSYLTFAIRETGVLQLLEEDSFPTNIVDALIGDQALVLRLIWDITYQILFLYILIAIITGVVIDAFGGLRDERDSAERDLKQYCFVCNLDRFHVDQHGIGFDKHVRVEHNPRWYLFFLLSLKQKPVSELTGQERYVMNQVWPIHGKVSHRWLPRDTTFTITRHDQDEDNQPIKELHSRIETLEERVEERVDSLAAALERNTAALDQVLSSLQNLGNGFERRGSDDKIHEGNRRS